MWSEEIDENLIDEWREINSEIQLITFRIRLSYQKIFNLLSKREHQFKSNKSRSIVIPCRYGKSNQYLQSSSHLLLIPQNSL